MHLLTKRMLEVHVTDVTEGYVLSVFSHSFQ